MQRYYKILELQFGAKKEDVKKAYRRLAHIHHPDKGGDAAKFKEINAAYNALMKYLDNPPLQEARVVFQGGFTTDNATTAGFRWYGYYG